MTRSSFPSAPLLRPRREGQADAAVADPSYLAHDYPSLEQLQWQPLADVGDVREEDHRARGGNIDQLDNVLAPAELEHRSVRQRGVSCLAALVDAALLTARD